MHCCRGLVREFGGSVEGVGCYSRCVGKIMGRDRWVVLYCMYIQTGIDCLWIDLSRYGC